jgi:general secretion pathway protein F/type IV pilus assembly protein PilC
MPDFQYIARETTGNQVAGVLTAASQQEALSTLASRSLFPISIDAAEAKGAVGGLGQRRVAARHLAVFYTQLADLLRSGVPLLRSLELLERQSSVPALKLVVQDVREKVADGTPLAEAMRQHPKAFGELGVSMVRAGEEGGFLEDVLKRIAAFTEHQQELKSRVVSAMVYPVFLLTMGSIIVVLILIFFVPKFEPIFSRMEERDGLPWATELLMSISANMQTYGIVLVMLLIGGFYALAKAIQTETGRRRFDSFRIRAIGFGPIIRSLAIARFCRILGTLLHNGVPILESLRIAKDATGNVVLTDAIARAAESVSAGKTLAQPLAASRQFPVEIIEMISVGEEANNLEQVLINVADTMEQRTNRRLDMFVRLLEPLLLLIMASIILFVMIALLVPILQSSSAF